MVYLITPCNRGKVEAIGYSIVGMSVSVSPSFSKTILQAMVSHRLMRIVSSLREYRGKQELYYQRKPELLQNLRSLAIIQSVESSNRLEQIYVPRKILKDIVLRGKTVDEKERSQGEIAGYQFVLSKIHESHPNMTLSSNIIRQLHRDLMSYVDHREGGGAEKAQNDITKLCQGEKNLFVPLNHGRCRCEWKLYRALTQRRITRSKSIR